MALDSTVNNFMCGVTNCVGQTVIPSQQQNVVFFQPDVRQCGYCGYPIRPAGQYPNGNNADNVVGLAELQVDYPNGRGDPRVGLSSHTNAVVVQHPEAAAAAAAAAPVNVAAAASNCHDDSDDH